MRDSGPLLDASPRSTPRAESARRALAAAAPCATVVSANFAAGCVGLFAPFGTAVTVLGLDWLHAWDVQQPILYGAAALSLFALAHAAWRHRRPLLLLLGLAGVVALLYPLHEAMDVSAFRWLSNAGAAGLLGAAAWSALLSRRTAAILVQPSVPHRVDPSPGSTPAASSRRPSLLALVAIGVVVGIRWLASSGPRVGGGRPADGAPEILRERCARGEIGPEEFQRRRHDLSRGVGA